MRTVARQKHPFWEPVSLDRLSELCGVRPVHDPADFRAAIWQSESELRDFLQDVRASRAATATAKEGDMRRRYPARAPRDTTGSRIREARLQRGLTLRHAAARVGITASYLSDIETDRRLPAWPVLERIASLVGLDPGELAALSGRLHPETERYLRTRPDVVRLLDSMARARLAPQQVERLRRAVERAAGRRAR